MRRKHQRKELCGSVDIKRVFESKIWCRANEQSLVVLDFNSRDWRHRRRTSPKTPCCRLIANHTPSYESIADSGSFGVVTLSSSSVDWLCGSTPSSDRDSDIESFHGPDSRFAPHPTSWVHTQRSRMRCRLRHPQSIGSLSERDRLEHWLDRSMARQSKCESQFDSHTKLHPPRWRRNEDAVFPIRLVSFPIATPCCWSLRQASTPRWSTNSLRDLQVLDLEIHDPLNVRDFHQNRFRSRRWKEYIQLQ